jgi:hypothetical protein
MAAKHFAEEHESAEDVSPLQGSFSRARFLPGPPLRFSAGYHIAGFQPDNSYIFRGAIAAGRFRPATGDPWSAIALFCNCSRIIAFKTEFDTPPVRHLKREIQYE